MCCNHAAIARTLREAEEALRPDAQLFSRVQDSLTPEHRAVVVDWLLDVAEEFGLRGETLFLAVDLLDRHLSSLAESTRWIQLLGAACIWTAAKVEEMLAPTSDDMVCLMEGVYTVTQLAHMERRMLQAVQHSVVRPTTYTFLSTLLHVSHAEQLWGSPPPGCSPAGGAGICPMCYWDVCEQKLPLATSVATSNPAQLRSFMPSNGSSDAGSTAASAGTSFHDLDGPQDCAADGYLGSSLGSDGVQTRPAHPTMAARGAVCGAWQHGDGQVSHAAARETGKPDGLEAHEQHMWLVYVSRLMAESCLLDHRVLQFLPSEVASCCLMLARSVLGLPAWTPALAQYTRVEGPESLASCLLTVADAFAAARAHTELHALRNRYSEGRRMDVWHLGPGIESLQLVCMCRTTLVATPTRVYPATAHPARHQAVLPSEPPPAVARAVRRSRLPPLMLDRLWTPALDSEALVGAQGPASSSHDLPSMAPLDLTPAFACELSPPLHIPSHLASSLPMASAPSPLGAALAPCAMPGLDHTGTYGVGGYLDAAPTQRGTKRHALAALDDEAPSPRCKLSHALHAGVWGSASSNATTECVSTCMADLISGLGLTSTACDEPRSGSW